MGPCPDAKTAEEAGGQELKVKVGLHRQGDLLDTEEFPLLSQLQGHHTILGPGEMLYIPPLVWHYVRSLEQSFSVSFWWE